MSWVHMHDIDADGPHLAHHMRVKSMTLPMVTGR